MVHFLFGKPGTGKTYTVASRFRDEAYTEWSSDLFWKFPVDLSQVTAVRFGDTEIPLK